MMSDADELPATVEKCHSLIRDLRSRLATKTRLITSLMGYDPTDAVVMGRYIAAMSNVERVAIPPEAAAEEPMRPARNGRRRKKT